MLSHRYCVTPESTRRRIDRGLCRQSLTVRPVFEKAMRHRLRPGLLAGWGKGLAKLNVPQQWLPLPVRYHLAPAHSPHRRRTADRLR